MDTPSFYEIRVEGQLTDHWCGWFDGLEIRSGTNDDTILSGAFPDQAALFGALNKVQALNLILISVHRLPAEEKRRKL